MTQICSPELLFQNYESIHLFTKIFFPKPFYKTTPENYALKLLPKAAPQNFHYYSKAIQQGSSQKLLLKIAIESSPKLLVKIISQSYYFSK